MLDFLGIGAQKSGTTWLYMNLRRHPQILLPDIKELHFWDQQRDKGLDWYRAFFETGDTAIRCGEITPAYAILPPDTIDEIAREFPNLKFFYLMRNPVDRAWSAALMALTRAEMAWDEASDQWFIDHFRSYGSARRGDYQTCLANWFRAFPRDRFLVQLFEDIGRQPRQVLEACASHLGLDPQGFDAVPEEHMRAKVFEGPGYPIRPRLHRFLVDFYAPRIDALEAFLGLDLSHWRDANDAAPPARLIDRVGDKVMAWLGR